MQPTDAVVAGDANRKKRGGHFEFNLLVNEKNIVASFNTRIACTADDLVN